jgi:hypothetical protein
MSGLYFIDLEIKKILRTGKLNVRAKLNYQPLPWFTFYIPHIIITYISIPNHLYHQFLQYMAIN